MLKRIIRIKVYFDRSRQYWGYVQTLMTVSIMLKVFENTGFGVWFWDHKKLTVPALLIVFVFMSIVVGYFDKRLNIREYEQGEINSTNPDIRKIHKSLQVIENKLK